MENLGFITLIIGFVCFIGALIYFCFIVVLLMLSGSYGLALLLSIAVIVALFWEV